MDKLGPKPIQKDGESEADFSMRKAVWEGKVMEQRKADRDASQQAESPIDKFKRLWETS